MLTHASYRLLAEWRTGFCRSRLMSEIVCCLGVLPVPYIQSAEGSAIPVSVLILLQHVQSHHAHRRSGADFSRRPTLDIQRIETV